MILTKKEILKEIQKKTIKISPLDKKAIGPASIDLTLDNKFRVLTKGKVVDVVESTDYRDYSSSAIKESILIKPGQTILGITKEKVTLPQNICGWLSGRSRFARLGLLIHLTAPFMSPGISNHQVLEIANLGPRTLRLHAGTKICQFVFQKAMGKAKYQGKFKSQTDV